MREWFDADFIPVMVPPWNRISDNVTAQLSALGFIGVSVDNPRHYAIEYGLRRCNTHVDIVAWRNQEAFIGTEVALELLIRHLKMKRTSRADCSEPTGLLTHHQRHDQASWLFINELLTHTRGHPAARWLSPALIFGQGTPF